MLSEYEALKSDTGAQETLINGVITLYASQEKNDSPDMFLQMKCIDYMKNFYQDYQFRTQKYAHLLGRISPICKELILKYLSREQNKEQNYQVINEILELFRYIVSWYAGYSGENSDAVRKELFELM